MKVLVTGSAGFIGGSILRGLQSLGYAAVGWDVRTSSHTTNLLNLASDPVHDALVQAAPDVVVHAAGPASVAASFRDPLSDYQGAVIPWLRLLRAIHETGLRPTVFLVSSAAVYGEALGREITEATPCVPISPYGYHRLCCEITGREHAALFGLTVAVIRLFSSFGPHQNRLLVWELFSQAYSSSREIVLQGTGNEVRDYLFETDLSRLVDRICHESPSGYSEWNLATGHSVSTGKLAELVAQATDQRKPIICQGIVRPGEPKCWKVDPSKVAQLLTGTRLVPLDEGLALCDRAWNPLRSEPRA